MKININNSFQNYTDLRLHTKEASSVCTGINKPHKFDAITIQSNPRQIEEHTFANVLSKELSKEISTPTSEEKISLLKQQINSGSYSVNAQEIAAKILLI